MKPKAKMKLQSTIVAAAIALAISQAQATDADWSLYDGTAATTTDAAADPTYDLMLRVDTELNAMAGCLSGQIKTRDGDISRGYRDALIAKYLAYAETCYNKLRPSVMLDTSGPGFYTGGAVTLIDCFQAEPTDYPMVCSPAWTPQHMAAAWRHGN